MKTLKGKQTERDVFSAARERMDIIYRKFDRVFVSFSGGKDSTVCLHLAIEAAKAHGKLPVEAVFFDEEAIYPTTVEYVDRIRQSPDVDLKWLCFPIEHRNACSRKEPYWYPWRDEDKDRWCRELPESAIVEMPNPGPKGWKYQGMPEVSPWSIKLDSPKQTVAMVLGIRAQESPRRRMIVSRRENENYINDGARANNVWPAYPIYDWTSIDVWFYPQLNGLDYNRTYDLFDMAGVSVNAQRVCPPFGEEPLAGLYLYSVIAPQFWEKMIRRVHGAATAARYAKTELYGFKDTPPPPGMTYKDWTFKLLDMWPQKERALIATSINAAMGQHAKKTKDPIPDSEPHAITAMSWKFISMLANHGDMKGRRVQLLRNKAMNMARKRGEDAAEVLASIGDDLGTRY